MLINYFKGLKVSKGNNIKKSDYHLVKQPEEIKKVIVEKLAQAKQLLETPIHTEEDLKKVRKAHTTWEDYLKEYLKRAFSDDTLSEQFVNSSFGMSFSMNPSLDSIVVEFQESFESEITYLESLIERIDLIPTRDGSHQSSSNTLLNDNIFIVHGQKHEIKTEVARFIERIKLKAIILDEQANEGKTIIEKFEHYSSTCRTAIVILTADDKVVADDDSKIIYRARQNVIFELGYFLSSLKREGVIALYEDNVEVPSDFYGVLYVSLKDDWKFKVARELKKRGLNIDLNALVE